MRKAIVVTDVQDTWIWWIKKVTIKSYGENREVCQTIFGGMKWYYMQDNEEKQMYLQVQNGDLTYKIGQKLDFYDLILQRPRKFISKVIVN